MKSRRKTRPARKAITPAVVGPTLRERLEPYQRMVRVWLLKAVVAAKLRVGLFSASTFNAWSHALLWLPLSGAFWRNIPLSKAASFIQEAVEAAGLEPAEYDFDYRRAVMTGCPLYGLSEGSTVPRRIVYSHYSPFDDCLVSPIPGDYFTDVSVKPSDLRKAVAVYVDALRAFNGVR